MKPGSWPSSACLLRVSWKTCGAGCRFRRRLSGPSGPGSINPLRRCWPSLATSNSSRCRPRNDDRSLVGARAAVQRAGGDAPDAPAGNLEEISVAHADQFDAEGTQAMPSTPLLLLAHLGLRAGVRRGLVFRSSWERPVRGNRDRAGPWRQLPRPVSGSMRAGAIAAAAAYAREGAQTAAT
jgi:hypothetical protein